MRSALVVALGFLVAPDAQRIRYNRAAAMQGTRGELTGELSVPRSLTESQRC